MGFQIEGEIRPVDPLARQGAGLQTAFIDPLGPLANLPGTWTGTGFSQIWRPMHGSNGHFLELNLTSETIEFTPSIGSVPNRGSLQPDIELFGVQYFQQVKDALTGDTIHIEPGFWLTAPQTSAPAEPATVIRLATIPHGVAANAQGTASTALGGPSIKSVSIAPAVIDLPQSAGPPGFAQFPESNLSQPTPFRSPNPLPAALTQAMVDNPNVVLTQALASQSVTRTTTLVVNTSAPALPPPPAAPNTGGGLANIAFLQGSAAAGPNAQPVQMSATFWIEEVAAGPQGPAFLQLQYSQTVILNFKGFSWPHVSVGTLRKQ